MRLSVGAGIALLEIGRHEFGIDAQRRLVARKSVVEAAELGERSAPIAERLGIVGRRLQSRVVTFDRLFITMQARQDAAADVQGGNVVRIAGERGRRGAQRLIEAIELHRGTGAFDADRSALWREQERNVVARDGFVVPTKGSECVAAVPISLDQTGIERQRPLVAGQSLVVATQVFQRIAAITVQDGIVGAVRQNAIEARQRLFVAFERAEHHAVIGERRRRVRSCLQCLSDQPQRLGIAAVLIFDEAGEVQCLDAFRIGRALTSGITIVAMLLPTWRHVRGTRSLRTVAGCALAHLFLD